MYDSSRCSVKRSAHVLIKHLSGLLFLKESEGSSPDVDFVYVIFCLVHGVVFLLQVERFNLIISQVIFTLQHFFARA